MNESPIGRLSIETYQCFVLLTIDMTIVRSTSNLGQSALAKTPLGRLCSHRPPYPPYPPSSLHALRLEPEFRFRFPYNCRTCRRGALGRRHLFVLRFLFPLLPLPLFTFPIPHTLLLWLLLLLCALRRTSGSFVWQQQHHTSSSSSSNNNYNNNNSISNW